MVKVWILNFFIVVLVQPAWLSGGTPMGSTGCSKKWPTGYCWRYCKGSSANWCYTRAVCRLQEESCANENYCSGISCFGAAEGCVVSCPEDDNVPLPSPSGATGCSFRYFFTTYCWRYCEGNTGNWCYTGTGCRDNEEACAYNEQCADITCSNSDGCVQQCVKETSCVEISKTPQTYLRNGAYRSSVLYSLRLSRDSRLPPYQTVFTTTTRDLTVYEHTELRRRGFPFTSLTCWPNHEYIPFREILRRRADEMERESNPDIVSSVPPGLHPITRVIQRRIDTDVLRVEVIEALIRPHHINAGNRQNFPAWTTDYMRNQLGGRTGDVRFHLVSNELSGPPELYNMIPGHESVNNNVGVPYDRRNNDWRSVERTMREHLTQDIGNYVFWSVGLYYEDLTSGRPTHLMYVACLYNGSDEIVFVLQGAVNNEQL